MANNNLFDSTTLTEVLGTTIDPNLINCKIINEDNTCNTCDDYYTLTNAKCIPDASKTINGS